MEDFYRSNSMKWAKAMANRIEVRLILDLHTGGVSNDMIAKTKNMSRTSVSIVLRIARKKTITYENVPSMDGSALYKMFSPKNYPQRILLNC